MADLKPPLQCYAIWAETTDSKGDRMQVIINELAQQHGTRRFGNHLTLLGLPNAREASENDLREKLEILKDYRLGECNTEIIGIGQRQAHLQSMFWIAAPNQELHYLRNRICDIFNQSPDAPYMPHWSALYGDIEQEEKNKIAQSLMGRFEFPFVVPITKISLIKAYGFPDEWQEVASFDI